MSRDLITDRVSTGGNAIASAVRMFPLLTFEPSDLSPFAYVMTVVLRELKVKVIGQGQTTKVKVKGRTRSV